VYIYRYDTSTVMVLSSHSPMKGQISQPRDSGPPKGDPSRDNPFEAAPGDTFLLEDSSILDIDSLFNLDLPSQEELEETLKSLDDTIFDCGLSMPTDVAHPSPLSTVDITDDIWDLVDQTLPSDEGPQVAGSKSRRKLKVAGPRATKRHSRDQEGNPRKSFRGVSRHRLTQRWEASLWLNGKQLYLGGFDVQDDAARAYDLAALACKGAKAVTNFPPDQYQEQLSQIQNYGEEEVVAHIRRRSAAFSRGRSRFRGVSGQNGRWEARIGSFGGRKNVSFGVFDTQEEAARQYDRALVVEKGRSAKTNFPLVEYEREALEYWKVKSLCQTADEVLRVEAAYTLPLGRIVTAEEAKKGILITGEALVRSLGLVAAV
jgi:hypothetical protein